MRKTTITATLCLIILSNICAQPVLREGWPVSIDPVGHLWSYNDLAIATHPIAGKMISASTNHAVAVLDENGQFLNGWPVELDYETDGVVVSGPRFGNIVGDDLPEIVVRVWNFDDGTRIYIYSLDGEQLPFAYEHPPQIPAMETRPMGAHILINLDTDAEDEIVFVSDTLLYGVNGDGSPVPGYPMYSGEDEGSRNSAPCFGLGEAWTGTDVIFWHTRTLIHGRYLSTLESLPGYPISYSADFYCSPISLIPRPDGWVLSIVDEDSLYAWDHSGQPVEGFPVNNPFINGGSETSYDVIVGDIDGDQEPELFYHVFENFLYGLHLDGNSVEGFPLDVIGNGSAEPFVILRNEGIEEGYIFGISNDPVQPNIRILGYHLDELLNGFPIQYDMERQNRPYAQTAIFPPVDGSMILVAFNRNGFLTAYDVPMPEGSYSMEWPMPGCTPGGNRLYDPVIYSSLVEEPSPAPPKQVRSVIYPNPSNSSFRLRFKLDAQGRGEVLVHDILGRKIFTDSVHSGAGRWQEYEWETRSHTQSISAGVYFITLIGETTTTQKAVLLP